MYSNNSKLNVVIIRPSNIYGVPVVSTVKRNTLVPKCFIDDAILKKSIIINSSGKQLRNYVSLSQLSDKIIKIIKNFPPNYSVINVGSNLNFTVKSILKKFTFFLFIIFLNSISFVPLKKLS